MVGELVRTAEEQARFKGDARAAILAEDEAGKPCACGTTAEEMCLAHYAVHGHRRHVRPGKAPLRPLDLDPPTRKKTSGPRGVAHHVRGRSRDRYDDLSDAVLPGWDGR